MRVAFLAPIAAALVLQLIFPPGAGAIRREAGWLLPPAANPRFVIYDLPAGEIESSLSIPYDEMVRRRSRVLEESVREKRAAEGKTAAVDTGVALILLCQWDDHPADTLAHPRSAFDTLLFSTGAVSTGSLREYFREVSYGKYRIEGEVHGWYSQPTYISSLYFTDFFAAADPFIDYSRFDKDGDGYTDAVWIFHAGPGQEETHDPADIWSFAVQGLNYMTDDGVIIDRFSCNPEVHVDGSIIDIRVPGHEATHVLGMPDLYDYDSKLDTTTYFTPGDANDHPVVDWCIMGYAGYNLMSYGTRTDPAHMCAWIKTKLGYITPTILSSPQQGVSLPEVELNQAVFKIEKSPGSAEYFLVENRNSASTAIFDHLDSDFSAYFPWFTAGRNPKDSGLIIYHVDDNVGSNTYGPNAPHYKVIVEDAGYDSATPWDGVSEFSGEWYPYEFRTGAAFAAEDSGQTSFTPLSMPSSDWYGASSGIWITNISASGGTMTFDIGFGNAWPYIAAHSPATTDTVIAQGSAALFSVTAVDEDGDALTYDWYENGVAVQSGAASTYSYLADSPAAPETLRVTATDGSLSASFSWIVTTDISTGTPSVEPLPASPQLVAAPTPFNPVVMIRYSLPRDADVRVAIHDEAGRLVTVLDDRFASAGSHTVAWRGKDRAGRDVASGVYFARLVSNGDAVVRKIVLIR